MSPQTNGPIDRRKHDPELAFRLDNGFNKPVPHGRFRSIGMGLITGAADDDPAAIGTYAAVGASLGPSFLWTVPVLFPMMFSVVYLCSKLGQVAGEGLFAVVKRHYSAWVLYPILICALVGNVIEAGADIGGMAAALNLVVPIPIWLIVAVISVVTAGLQIWGSYTLIRNIFRWLALVLIAYVGAAFLAKPDLGSVLRGTFVPTIHFDTHSLSMLVAIVVTTLRTSPREWCSQT